MMKMKYLIYLIVFSLILLFTKCGLQKKVNNSKAIVELTLVREKIHTNHPNSNYFSERHYTDSVYNEVYKIILSKNRISKHELFKEISKYTSSFNDGHMRTKLSTFHLVLMLISGKALPFEVVIKDNKIIIDYDYTNNKKNKEGNQIHSINGIPSEEILNDLKSKIPLNNPNSKNIFLSHSFPYKYWKIGNETSPFSIEFINKHNDTIIQLFKGLRFSKYVRSDTKRKLKGFKKTFKMGSGNFILSRYYIENEKLLPLPKYYCYLKDTVAYLRIKGFTGKSEQKEFYKKCFATIHELNTNILIIDIRRNIGGRMTNFEDLFSYLSNDTIYQANKVNFKLNDVTLKMALEANEKGDTLLYNKIKPYSIGDVLPLLEKDEMIIYKPDNPFLFLGKIVVIIDAGTFSAGSGFAKMVQSNNIGLVIGEETGGMTNAFADPIIVKLSVSKCYLTIPTKQIFQSDSTTISGVKPDKHIVFDNDFRQDPDSFINEIDRKLNN